MTPDQALGLCPSKSWPKISQLSRGLDVTMIDFQICNSCIRFRMDSRLWILTYSLKASSYNSWKVPFEPWTTRPTFITDIWREKQMEVASCSRIYIYPYCYLLFRRTPKYICSQYIQIRGIKLFFGGQQSCWTITPT